MNKSFGQTIKDARNSRSMTQARVCEAVKDELVLRGVADVILTQPTLSAWEGERQMPSGENMAVLQALEKVLKLKSTVIKGVLRDKGKRAGRAPDDEYADDVEEWLKSARITQSSITVHPRIWFLAPSTLPAFLDTTNRMFKLWENNILYGVQYKMLWILEEITDSEAFSELGRTLVHLHESVEKRRAGSEMELGDMKIYLVRRPEHVIRQHAADPLTEENNEREFDKLVNFWSDKCSWITWCKLGRFKDLDPQGKENRDREVYDYIENVRSELVGRLAIYLGAQSPQASMLITDTSARYGGEMSRVYRWLDKRDANFLASIAEKVEAWIDSKESKKQ